MPITSREILRRLREAGWTIVRIRGSHHHLRHPEQPRIVTVKHPVKDMKLGTLKSIERQSGVKLR